MSFVEVPDSWFHSGLNLSKLNVDEAYVTFESEHASPVWVYALSADCVDCPFKRFNDEPLVTGANRTEIISTKVPLSFRLRSSDAPELVPASADDDHKLCDVAANFGEFGVYRVHLGGHAETSTTCSLITEQRPVNIYFPILVVFLSAIAVWLSYVAGRRLLARVYAYIVSRRAGRVEGVRFTAPSPIMEETLSSSAQSPTRPDSGESPKMVQKSRIQSLDAFRGITIVLMIFVNDGAGAYWFMHHATWNGLHVADLVFPWFMWIMGVCVPISVRSQLRGGVRRRAIIAKFVRRSAILFALGVCLNSVGHTDIEKLRLFGVLQRFGVVQLVVGCLVAWFTPGNLSAVPAGAGGVRAYLKDITILLPQWIIVLTILGVHTTLVFLLQVPGCPTGYLGPGGIHENGTHRDCVGGATGLVDRLILGTNHIYQHPTSKYVYGSGAFDPEGILGCLTSIVQVFFGVQAGMIILVHSAWKGRFFRWLLWGLVTGALGAALCGASHSDGLIPLNKNLWSLSYVLVTSCFAFILLAVCYLVIDVFNWWSGAPFESAGKNALLMYIGHEIAIDMLPWHWAFRGMRTHLIRLAEAVWGTALWVLIAVWLHRKKIFLVI